MTSSILYPGEHIFDDSTQIPVPDGLSTGYKGMFAGGGYGDGVEQFPSSLIIPRSEWQARIQEMEERKSRLSDIWTASGFAPLNQGNTNYCWIFAPTAAAMLIRVIQGQQPVVLSPASAGGPIKNFRNVGGWGEEGLQWISERGLVPADRWPTTAISRQYYTEENKSLALNYRTPEWWRLRPRNIEELVSCLLRRIPVAVGYNWWGHEVLAMDAVWRGNDVDIRILNSWGDIPQFPRGFGILSGNKRLPDDAVAPRTAVAA